MSYSKKFNLTQEVISNYSSSDEEVTPKSYKKIQTIWKDLRQVFLYMHFYLYLNRQKILQKH